MGESQTPNITDADLPDLTNKILMIVQNGSGDSHLPVEQVRFEVQGGRLCLVGRIPQDAEFLDNIPIVVAWDSVSHYFVFDRHQFETVYKSWMATIRKRRSLLERIFGKS